MSKYRKTHSSSSDIYLIHIKASFNNTIITLTDNRGRVKVAVSAGMIYKDGPRKSTASAAKDAVKKLFEIVAQKKYKVSLVRIIISGPGFGRDAAVEEITFVNDIIVMSVADVTPIPHNGCRPKKRRRT
jgi:small subunit ribosomal protein S11